MNDHVYELPYLQPHTCVCMLILSLKMLSCITADVSLVGQPQHGSITIDLVDGHNTSELQISITSLFVPNRQNNHEPFPKLFVIIIIAHHWSK